MKIKAKLHPNSSQEKIEKVGENYEVWLREKPLDNKANLKLIKMMKKYFGLRVKIIFGFNSRNKILEVEDED